jgi:hypothetical protein
MVLIRINVSNFKKVCVVNFNPSHWKLIFILIQILFLLSFLILFIDEEIISMIHLSCFDYFVFSLFLILFLLLLSFSAVYYCFEDNTHELEAKWSSQVGIQRVFIELPLFLIFFLLNDDSKKFVEALFNLVQEDGLAEPDYCKKDANWDWGNLANELTDSLRLTIKAQRSNFSYLLSSCLSG